MSRRITMFVLVGLGLVLGSAARGEQAAPTSNEARNAAITARVLVKVVHPTEVRAAVLERLKALGGFPTLVTDTQLTLKVPPAKLGELVDDVIARGVLIERGLEREDLTERIADLRGRLRSRIEVLAKLRAFIDDSDVSATLEIERTMVGLVTEVERAKGELRVLEDRSSWAVVDVSFSFQQRDRLVYVSSPFRWLNTVDLDRFVREF